MAAQEADQPFDYCDVVTTTTHKSLRGPRAGMIFSRKVCLPCTVPSLLQNSTKIACHLAAVMVSVCLCCGARKSAPLNTHTRRTRPSLQHLFCCSLPVQVHGSHNAHIYFLMLSDAGDQPSCLHFQQRQSLDCSQQHHGSCLAVP